MSAAAPVADGEHPGRGAAWPSAKTIYALRACIVLASIEPGTRLKTREIAQAAAVPKGFLSKILGELRTAGIISAHRGYHGGYGLTRPAEYIHVDELLNAVGSRDLFSPFSGDGSAALPFIDDLRRRLHTLTEQTLHCASLADLVGADTSGAGAR